MDWDAMLKAEMDAAVRQRQRCKEDDSFLMSVKVISPRGEIADTGLQWSNETEKHFVMGLVTSGCKALGAQAVIVTSDARFLNTDGFCKRFNIVRPEVDFQAFDRERRRVMAGFQNYMGNLPSDCYNDVLLVTVKGPAISRMISTPYRVTENGIVFAKTEEATGGVLTINLIPTWWKETVQ